MVRVNLINEHYKGIQVVSYMEDEFDLKELFKGFYDKKVFALGIQPMDVKYEENEYKWSNGDLDVNVVNLKDGELYFEYIYNHKKPGSKNTDFIVLGKEESNDKVLASLLLQGLIKVDEDQVAYVIDFLKNGEWVELEEAFRLMNVLKIQEILDSKKKQSKIIKKLSKDKSIAVEKILDHKLTHELVADLKDELKKKEKRDKILALSLVQKLKKRSLSEFNSNLIEEFANSKSGVFERIIVTVMLRDGDPIETEDMLIKIFTKGSGDEQTKWMLARHFSKNVPVKEHNKKELQKFYGKGLRRLQKMQWDLSLEIGIEGNYSVINEILEDILLHKKEPRYVYVKMIAVNNAEVFFGDRWREILQQTVADDLLLKKAIKVKLEDGNKRQEYKKVKLDLHKNEDRIKGALYAFAIGDCIGAPIEIMKKDEIIEKYGEVDDFIEDSNLNTDYGEHTDDTELTLVVFESLMRNNGFNLSDILEEYKGIADRYDYGTDVDRHFSHNTLMAFRRLTMNQHPLLSGNDSLGNGALIRVLGLAVLAMYDDEDNLYKDIEKCCVPSHNNDEAIEAAYLTALVEKYCLETEDFNKDQLLELLLNNIKNERLKESVEKIQKMLKEDSNYDLAQSELGTSGRAIQSFSYALFCFIKNSGDFKDLIRASVNIDGDSDSIGAVAASFYGALHGIDSIPKDLINKLKCKKRIESLFE